MRAMVLNGTKMSCYDQIKVRGMQHIMTQRDVIYCHQNSTVLHSLVKDISDVVLLLRSTILYFTALYCYSISIVTLSLAPPPIPFPHTSSQTYMRPSTPSFSHSFNCSPPPLPLSLHHTPLYTLSSCTRLHTHSHTHIHSHIHTYTHTSTLTHTHTYLLSHIHSHLHCHFHRA